MIRRPHSSRSTLGGCDCESRPPACSGRDVVQVARTALLRRVAAATKGDEDLLLRGAAVATKSDEDLLLRRAAAATKSDEDLLLRGAAAATKSDEDLLLRRAATATKSDEDLLLRGAAAATGSDEDLLLRRVAAATKTCSCKELLRRRRPVPVKGSSGGGCPGLAWGGGGARAMVRSTTCSCEGLRRPRLCWARMGGARWLGTNPLVERIRYVGRRSL